MSFNYFTASDVSQDALTSLRWLKADASKD